MSFRMSLRMGSPVPRDDTTLFPNQVSNYTMSKVYRKFTWSIRRADDEATRRDMIEALFLWDEWTQAWDDEGERRDFRHRDTPRHGTIPRCKFAVNKDVGGFWSGPQLKDLGIEIFKTAFYHGRDDDMVGNKLGMIAET